MTNNESPYTAGEKRYSRMFWYSVVLVGNSRRITLVHGCGVCVFLLKQNRPRAADSVQPSHPRHGKENKLRFLPFRRN